MIELLQGNCLELLPPMGQCTNLLVTDPPYKTITGGDKNGIKSERPAGMLSGNRKLFIHQKIVMEDWMKVCYDALFLNSHAYIFTNALNMEEMLTTARKVGFQMHNILVWIKNNCTPSQYYMKNCEYVLFLRKGQAKWIYNIGSSKTAHTYNNILGTKTHPCEKPVDLLSLYISNSSVENETVLDPFMGSGATGVAARNLYRSFIGIELDENYFNIAKERIEGVTRV